MTLDKETEMVHFVFGEGALQSGKTYALKMYYTGPISDDVLSGIYRSHYTEKDGTEKWLACTQMEATDGRRALPLYDEPQLKAVFWVTIEHPLKMVALSNGLESPTKDLEDGWGETKFTPSKRMASYLLALLVADFVHTDKMAANGTVQFRIWARPEVKKQLEYATDIGAKILDYYAEFFGIPYPLEKVDMVALPDFEAGAMENWGLINYREKYLLYEPSVYSKRDKQLVAVVVAHELAHMFDQFVTTSIQESMAKDQLATSHPLYVTVEKALDVFESFDSISYEKGGSIIKMIQNVMGEDNFKRGLNRYLTTFKYGSATNNDLWDSLSKEMSVVPSWSDPNSNSVDITLFAKTWTLQMGYPLIDVKLVEGGKKATLSQRRFKLDESAVEKEKYSDPPYDYKWYVPMWYQTSFIRSQSDEFVWLTPENQETTIDLGSENWLIVNPDAKAYARVKYPESVYDEITKKLDNDHRSFSVATKCQLLDDAFSLARASKLNYSIPLEMSGYLMYEEEYLPWEAAMAHFGLIGKLVQFTEAEKLYMEYMKVMLYGGYHKFAWGNTNNDMTVLSESLRGLVTGAMCKSNYLPCMQRAALFMDQVLKNCTQADLSSDCNTVNQVYRSTIYCEACKRSSDKHFDIFWQKYKSEPSQIEKQRIMRALMCTRDLSKMYSILDKAINLDEIRKQDVTSIFYYASIEKLGAEMLWDYFETNYDVIKEKFKEGVFIFKRLITYAMSNLTTRKQIEKVKDFLEKHPDAKEYTAFKEQLEKAEANVAWIEKNYDLMYSWFNSFEPVHQF